MSLFRTLTLRGTAGRVVAGYFTAATLQTWAIHRTERGAWTVTGAIATSNPVYLRLRPLVFTVPRRGGFFCWTVKVVYAPPRDGPAGVVFSADLDPPDY